MFPVCLFLFCFDLFCFVLFFVFLVGYFYVDFKVFNKGFAKHSKQVLIVSL